MDFLDEQQAEQKTSSKNHATACFVNLGVALVICLTTLSLSLQSSLTLINIARMYVPKTILYYIRLYMCMYIHHTEKCLKVRGHLGI